jgi:hypothetical protein
MHHRERNLRTGKLICDFIELHKRTQGGPPTWDEVVNHLNQVGHPTKRGAPWGTSAAQNNLVKYCTRLNIDYPMTTQTNSLIKERIANGGNLPVPEPNEVTITLKITLPANQKFNIEIV